MTWRVIYHEAVFADLRAIGQAEARTILNVITSRIQNGEPDKLGKPLALSTIYAMLARHGWRKVAPDKIHPKSDPDAQQDWKKNCRGAWQKKEPDLP